MHPELFHFQLPDLLGNIQVKVYTYAFCIALGCLVTGIYTKRQARKDLGINELSNNFFYLIFTFGFVGGKLFYYLEKPDYYWNNPSLLLDNFSGGFVFYGSFVTIIPMIVLYLKRQNIPVLPMLDILAITTLIVHTFGRFGCFNAGCCYGSPTNSWTGIVFPTTNHVAVHPTQLYEVYVLLMLLGYLLIIKEYKNFHGQIFLLYLGFYGVCRGILEFFRGDTRGFIIKDILSHSQFIAILILIATIYFYKKLQTKTKLILNNQKMKNNFFKIILPMMLLVVATFIIGSGCGSFSEPTPPPPIQELPIVLDVNGDPFPTITDAECKGNLITNGYFNTTTQSPNIQFNDDIIAATGWRRVWEQTAAQNVIGADLFSSSFAANGVPPTPASGNYASMWINNLITANPSQRQVMFNRLHQFIKPSPLPEVYALEFKTAKLNNFTQQVEFSVYGVNYDDKTPETLPSFPTGAFLPTNSDLFGVANTVLLGTIIIPAGADNTWVNQSITIDANAKGFLSAGINYILITKSEKDESGSAYCAFDDFCLHKK